jgi:hypothetical protein
MPIKKVYRLIRTGDDLFKLILEQTMESGTMVTGYVQLVDGRKEGTYAEWVEHCNEWGIKWTD